MVVVAAWDGSVARKAATALATAVIAETTVWAVPGGRFTVAMCEKRAVICAALAAGVALPSQMSTACAEAEDTWLK